ncbi:MAG: response regulator [Nitrospirae bacterium]|nr:response regulator [Nitrospirota bacterium]
MTAKTPDTKGKTILYANCEQGMADYISGILKGRYNVIITCDAVETLNILQGEQDIAVVISDLPVAISVALFAEIKTIRPHCKVMLLTSHLDVDAAKHAIEQGAINKYLTRPWNKKRLQRQSMSWLRRITPPKD